MRLGKSLPSPRMFFAFLFTEQLFTTIWEPGTGYVVACMLAVVCKWMQQLPTMLGPAVHRGKDTTHKSL